MSYNWASWIWTNECGSQSPVPYRLAIAHYILLYQGWMMGFEPSASRATIWRANQLRYIHHMPYTMTKAGDGNRTHVFSLEGWCSTIEPHLQNQVSLKGFEPPTLGLEGRCSIQLSYRLKYSIFRKQIGVTGFEPATPWSQTRYSSQTEPHPVFNIAVSLTHGVL